jgi:hypothetical protein
MIPPSKEAQIEALVVVIEMYRNRIAEFGRQQTRPEQYHPAKAKSATDLEQLITDNDVVLEALRRDLVELSNS